MSKNIAVDEISSALEKDRRARVRVRGGSARVKYLAIRSINFDRRQGRILFVFRFFFFFSFVFFYTHRTRRFREIYIIVSDIFFFFFLRRDGGYKRVIINLDNNVYLFTRKVINA